MRNCISMSCPEGAARLLPSLWRTVGCPSRFKDDRLDIFHGLSNELPLNTGRGVKTVVTIHDLIFLRYPQFYRPIDRQIYEMKFRRACQVSDYVISVSECTKNDIINYFGIDEAKIRVIYQSCDRQFGKRISKSDRAETLHRHGIPDNFILYVGSIEQRKNLALAVRALADVPEVNLVAIGRATDYQREVEATIDRLGLRSRVMLLNSVGFGDFPAIYQSARCFVYPSFFEGFGIPVLEALKSGTPVIAATGSCLEEAGGPDSIYVSPDSAEEMAAALKAVLDSPARAAEMSARGKAYAEKFEPEKIAREMSEVYKSLVG
jgi:glycosyltransferase involved in cell wall biosynthesis